ncbi:MAG TPA: WhiB family transcriptional regulator [Jatrophihabitantaceae bacterium]|jgi:WhiB family redox-sensing transcriptional regulator
MLTDIRIENHTNSSTHDWRDLALCSQVDPELWFPEKGDSNRAAKLICGWCEVREQCLAVALATNEEHGVWGGLSREERRRLRRRSRAVTPVEIDGEAA